MAKLDPDTFQQKPHVIHGEKRWRSKLVLTTDQVNELYRLTRGPQDDASKVWAFWRKVIPIKPTLNNPILSMHRINRHTYLVDYLTKPMMTRPPVFEPTSEADEDPLEPLSAF